MALINSVIMRGAKQKLGGVVFYQQSGRTLARELAPQVSNPRTSSQMNQRTKLANVVEMYKANKFWMKGAFESKPAKESDYNAFVKANLATSLVSQSKSEAAANACVVAPYVVTSGSILSIEHNVSGLMLISNIYLGNLTIDANTTVGDFSTAVIAANNQIREGMQLSLIVNMQRVNEVTGIPYVVVRAYELIFNKTSQALLSDYFGEGILGNGGNNDDQLRANLRTLEYGGACFILSESVGGKTSVSSQSLVMYGPNQVYTTYTAAGKAANDAASYGENQEAFLDSNSANTAAGVIISGQIVSARINGVQVTPGGTAYGNVEMGDEFPVFFSSVLEDVEDTSARIVNRVTGDNIAEVSCNFEPTAPTAVSVFADDTISIGATTPVTLTITIDGREYSMDFTWEPDDIS